MLRAAPLLLMMTSCMTVTEGTGRTSTAGSSGSSVGEESSSTTDESTTGGSTDTGDLSESTSGTTEQDSTTESATDAGTTESPPPSFDAAEQWYCGPCSPTVPATGKDEECEGVDGDAFCKFLTGDPDAISVAFSFGPVIDAPGFCCHGMGPTFFDVLPGFDEVCYDDVSLLESEHVGNVIYKGGLDCEIPEP